MPGLALVPQLITLRMGQPLLLQGHIQ